MHHSFPSDVVRELEPHVRSTRPPRVAITANRHGGARPRPPSASRAGCFARKRRPRPSLRRRRSYVARFPYDQRTVFLTHPSHRGLWGVSQAYMKSFLSIMLARERCGCVRVRAHVFVSCVPRESKQSRISLSRVIMYPSLTSATASRSVHGHLHAATHPSHKLVKCRPPSSSLTPKLNVLLQQRWPHRYSAGMVPLLHPARVPDEDSCKGAAFFVLAPTEMALFLSVLRPHMCITLSG